MFDGRSNQFLHNEAWLIAIYEFEAKHEARVEHLSLATKIRIATERARNVMEDWFPRSKFLYQKPASHIDTVRL